MFCKRTYRTQFNVKRFTGFEVKYLETDLWIGIDPESFRVEMKDGIILDTEPEGLIGYTSVPFREWFNDLPYA